jgi:hypothetical protein
MSIIDELRNYVNDKAHEFLERTAKSGTYRVSTMCTDAYGWDKKLHTYMPDIVNKLKELGVYTSHSVNHQVDDWDMKLVL